jgi:hypothetical protein
MAKKTVTFKVGRNAGTGRFTPVEKAKQDKAHHVVETIKRPGTTKGK